MTTLVTGASGFIGSAVVRKLLARGRAVRVLVEAGAHRGNLDGLDVEVIEGDIRDRAAVARAVAGVRSIFHLAAIYRLWLPRPRVMFEVNVEGTRNLLFAAMRAQVERFVHTSSIAALGLPAPDELADERTPFNYWHEGNDYMRSKWLSERTALGFAAEGVPVVVVNPAFPFGPRDAEPTPTGRFIVDFLNGRIFGYAGGGFNAIDVDDVAEGHLLAEQRGRVGERYILGNYNVSYREFFELVADAAGMPPVRRELPDPIVRTVAWAAERVARYQQNDPYVTVDAANYATRRVWFDNSKARRELDLPRTPLRITVEKAVTWYRNNGYVESRQSSVNSTPNRMARASSGSKPSLPV